MRSAGSGKLVFTIDSEDGTIIAAPTPWTTRAAMRATNEGAAPQARDVTANNAKPAMKICLGS